ncbi:MAG: TolC family protein [Spirochaetes bacterium]|nr:TolC family protein [Spirochaetota bacterium]
MVRNRRNTSASTVIAAATALLAIVLPLHESAAQQQKSRTVESLVRIALENYGLLKVKETEIRQKSQSALQAKSWDNPELGITAGQKRSDGDSGLLYSATLSQRLPLSGRRGLLSEMSNLEEEEARIALEDLSLRLRYDVVKLVYEHARDLLKTSHIRERLRRLRLINAYMQGHLIVAPQKIVERNIVQARIRHMEREFLDIRRGQVLSFEKLNRYLKLHEEGPLDLEVRWFATAPKAELAPLLEAANRRNFEIRTQAVAVQMARKGVSLARREAVPDIEVSLFYQDERAGTHDQSIGGGVSLPLPVLSRNRYGIRRETMNQKSRELLLEHVRHDVAQRVKEAYAEYRHAAEMIALFPLEELRDMERRMDYADAEFRKGRISLTTYLEMDSALHETIESVFDAQLSLIASYAELNYLAGITGTIEGDAP